MLVARAVQLVPTDVDERYRRFYQHLVEEIQGCPPGDKKVLLTNCLAYVKAHVHVASEELLKKFEAFLVNLRDAQNSTRWVEIVSGMPVDELGRYDGQRGRNQQQRRIIISLEAATGNSNRGSQTTLSRNIHALFNEYVDEFYDVLMHMMVRTMIHSYQNGGHWGQDWASMQPPIAFDVLDVQPSVFTMDEEIDIEYFRT
tara:strand:- start:250 stop:849 length:600 start_codon:yes stop_codon:yes gene_type:complete